MSSSKPTPSFARSSYRIRRNIPAGLFAASALVGFGLCREARAQIDSNPPLQNVMLLVDTSGSMEYATDGSKVQCAQVDATLTSEPKGTSQKSRWTQLVEVLTGEVNNYACYSQDRTSTTFRDEFRLGSVDLVPSCSVGFVTFSAHPGPPDALVAQADQALYAAKRAGRRRWASADGLRPVRRKA